LLYEEAVGFVPRTTRITATACQHRGDVIGEIASGCAACKGQPIHACSIHEKCVNTQRQREEVKGARACEGCSDFTPVISTTESSTGKIRVGFLTPVLNVGGVERWLVTLAKHTSPAIEWVGCCLHPEGATHPDMVAEVSQLMPVHRDRYRLFSECDVLIIWGENHAPDLAQFKGKIIHVIHGVLDWSESCAAVNSDNIDQYIGVSDAATAIAPAGRECVTILNGLDTDHVIPSADWRTLRDEFDIDEDETVVCYVGRYSNEKNPTAAAQAAGEIGATAVYCCPSIPERERDKLQHLANGKVTYAPCDRVADTFTMADVFVHNGDPEPFGLVFIEAWYCGCPIVCNDVGVIPIAEQMTGVTLSVKLTTTLGEAAIKAIENRRQLVKSGRKAALLFSAEQTAQQYEEVLNRIMNSVKRSSTHVTHRTH